MPVIPTFVNDEQVPVNPGPPRADPNAFSAPADALQHTGNAVTDIMSDFNARYQEARRQADVSNVIASTGQQLNDLQFSTSKIPDRQQATAAFNQGAAQIKQQGASQLSDPFALSLYSRQFDQESISRQSDVMKDSFALESSQRRGQLDSNLASYATQAAASSNPITVAHLTDNANMAIDGAVAAGWLAPQEGADRKLSYTSQMQENKVKSDLADVLASRDPQKAAMIASQLDNGGYPGLLPQARDALRDHIEAVHYRLSVEEASRVAHQDARAEHDLRQYNAQNEATMLAATLNGQPPSASDIATALRNNAITSSGAEMLTGAAARQRDGYDNPKAAAALYQALGNNALAPDDIYHALGRGDIKGTTAVDLMKAVNEQGKEQNRDVVNAAFAQLKTAFSGNAIEQGLFPDKSPQTIAWGQVQTEFTRRARIAHEDPMATALDIEQRYAPMNLAGPIYLPAPRLGPVTNVDDLPIVALQTIAAHNAGRMDDPTYNNQLDLLNQYKRFFDNQGTPMMAPKKPAQQVKPAETGQ